MRMPSRIFVAALLALSVACDGPSPTSPGERADLAVARAKSALGAPSDVQIGPAGFTAIDVYWVDNATAESGFEIYRSTTGITGSFTLRGTAAANATVYHDTGLDWTVQYCYEIRSVQAKGKTSAYSAFTAASCMSPTSPELNAPTGLGAKPAGSTVIALAWTPNHTTETGYHVERSLDAGTTWTRLADVAATTVWWTATATDSNRTPEVSACYRVEAFNALRTSVPSNVACTAPPAAPTSLAAGFDGFATVTVTWSDNSHVERGYSVQRATAAGGPFTTVAFLDSNATTFRDRAITGGNTYWYYVVANADGGSSDPSNAVSVNVPMSIPAAPTYVETWPSFEGDAWHIGVDWGDVSAVEDGFRIEKSLDGGATWATLATVTANQTAYGDDRVPLEQRDCYRVIAFNAMGSSPPSPVACASTPTAPSNVTAVALDPNTIQITWTDNSSVEDGFCAQGYSPEEGMWGSPGQITGPNVTSYVIGGLDPGTTIWVRIGVSSGYACGIGGEVSATTPLAP